MTGVSYQIAHLLEKVGGQEDRRGSLEDGWRMGMVMVIMAILAGLVVIGVWT